MRSWQKHARVALGAFLLVFGAVVYLGVHRRQAPPQTGGVKRTDPNAVVESTGAQVTQFKGARQNFRVEAENQLRYASGATRLKGARIFVDQRAGRNFRVTGREAELNETGTDVKLVGDVRMTSSDGLDARTGEASYSDSEGVVHAPGPVEFTTDRLSGNAVGMTYDKNRDVLWLLAKAVVKIAPDKQSKGGVEIFAGAAGVARRDKYMRFERGVRVLHAGQVIEADNATAFLSDDEKRIQMIELRDGSRVTSAKGASGSLQAMSARDINLTYAAEGERLERAVLAGDSAIQIAGSAPGRSRRIAGDWIDLQLGPDGNTVTSLGARDRVELDLPAEADAPRRVIRAPSLQASGEEGKGLTSASFGESVEFREIRPAGAAPRIARSRTLALTVKPGLGAVESARFAGGVRFEEGELRASARDARYFVDRGVIALAGTDEQTGQQPRVVDEQATIEAKRIDLQPEGPKVTASEGVNSVLQPARQQAAAQPGGQPPPQPTAPRPGQPAQATRMPAILKQDQPTNVTAANLEYDGGAGHAVYTGNVRLWQPGTTIKGNRLVLDDSKGDLTASGSVVTTMLLLQTNDKTKAKEQTPTTGAAADLHYEDAIRRATYTTNAHLSGTQGDLTADKIELYLDETGDEVERIEGYKTVNLLTTDGRRATGDRMTYFASDERYVMKGVPVKIIEECRETTGKTLTFFKSTDRIIVDGNEETRTQTKGGTKCGEPRFD